MKKGKALPRNTAFIDEALLKRIASETSGEYFRAKDKEDLEEVYSQIDRLEKSELEIITKTKYEELFFYFIAAGLLFLALAIILRFTLFRTFP
jgi:Ca-activated chloride channel family protein